MAVGCIHRTFLVVTRYQLTKIHFKLSRPLKDSVLDALFIDESGHFPHFQTYLHRLKFCFAAFWMQIATSLQ